MEKQTLSTTLIYVLSVLGFLCCCFGGLGFIPAGAAYFISHKKLKEAYADHERFENIEGMNTAKIVALVALGINILYFLWTIYRIYEMGGVEGFMEQYNEVMEEINRNR